MPVSGDIYYFGYPTEALELSPLFLIHGAGGSHMHWPPNVRRLAGWRIFAPDLPGHGKSVGQNRTSIDEYARDMVGFMSSFDVPSAVWIGHSMGSAIALTIALHHPELVTALILIGSGAKLRVDPEILSKAGDSKLIERAVGLMIERLYGSKVDPKLRELGLEQLLENGAGVIYSDLLACDNFDIRAHLNKISQPTLILCGREDQMTPLKYSEYLAGNISHSSLRIHPNAGHMIMLEQPDWVQQEIENFLKPFTSRGTSTIQEVI